MNSESTYAVPADLHSHMPRYRCHKEVRALKIEQVIVHDPPAGMPCEGGFLFFAKKAGCPPKAFGPHITVSLEYLTKHRPESGGYYVLYEDGYTSFSPGHVFESGYTRIEEVDATMRNLYAHTAPGCNYPPFISINGDEKHVEIHVRSEAKPDGACGDQAMISLTREEFASMQSRDLAR